MTDPHLTRRVAAPRRRVLRGGVVLALAGWGLWARAQAPRVGAGHAALPSALSLREELAAALARKSPLVVMVSLDGCPFCRAARQSHLLPMWRDGLPIVQVDFRSEQKVIDFQGHARTHDDLIRSWRVTLAPTLIFFGPGGREVEIGRAHV